MSEEVTQNNPKSSRRKSRYSNFVPKTNADDATKLKAYMPKKEKQEESHNEKCLKKDRGDMRKNDTICGLFASGLQCINFLEVEEYFREDLPDKERNVSSQLNFWLRVVMLALSGILGLHIFFHYKYKLQIEILLKKRHEKET